LSEVSIEFDGDERPAGDERPDTTTAVSEIAPPSHHSGTSGESSRRGSESSTDSDSGPVMQVVGEGGSSSSYATTYIGKGVEWSATGRKGVSLAELSGLHDTGFSFERAISRLTEMQSQEYEIRWRRKWVEQEAASRAAVAMSM